VATTIKRVKWDDNAAVNREIAARAFNDPAIQSIDLNNHLSTSEGLKELQVLIDSRMKDKSFTPPPA